MVYNFTAINEPRNQLGASLSILTQVAALWAIYIGSFGKRKRRDVEETVEEQAAGAEVHHLLVQVSWKQLFYSDFDYFKHEHLTFKNEWEKGFASRARLIEHTLITLLRSYSIWTNTVAVPEPYASLHKGLLRNAPQGKFFY